MNGRVPNEPLEKAPSRLPLLRARSTQRSSRQPRRRIDTYSSPSGAMPAVIHSTAWSKGTSGRAVASGALIS